MLAVGKTLNKEDALIAMDKEFFEKGDTDFTAIKLDQKNNTVKNSVDEVLLKAYIDYAVMMSNRAVERLQEGVIKPSPYENACDYCEFSALCGEKDVCARSIGALDKSVFEHAVNNGGDD